MSAIEDLKPAVGIHRASRLCAIDDMRALLGKRLEWLRSSGHAKDEITQTELRFRALEVEAILASLSEIGLAKGQRLREALEALVNAIDASRVAEGKLARLQEVSDDEEEILDQAELCAVVLTNEADKVERARAALSPKHEVHAGSVSTSPAALRAQEDGK